LNIEDFPGKIEIAGCRFFNNTHFIPEILIPPLKNTYVKNSDHFYDVFQTNEIKMSICNQDTFSDEYFFA